MARGRRRVVPQRRLTIIAVGARGEIEKSDLDRRATLRVLFRCRVCWARASRVYSSATAMDGFLRDVSTVRHSFEEGRGEGRVAVIRYRNSEG